MKTFSCIATGALALASQLSAQVSLSPTTPRFAAITQRAQEGYGDSARADIAHIIATMPTTDPAYVEALYTTGVVARSGDSMRAVFSRIVVDYSGSPWADKSLLRLITLDYGFAKMDLVITETTRAFSDFPDSPVIPTAALWGARAAFSLQKMQLGCGWVTKGIAAVGSDLELKNQLLYAKQSCNIGNGVQYAPLMPDSLRKGPPPTDTAAHPPAPPPPPPPPPATKPDVKTSAPAKSVASPWRIQVAAVRDKAVIQQVSKKIESAGFKVYLVPVPGGLTRVQVGPFATRAAAVAALPKVKGATGGSPIVVAAP